MDIKLGVEVLCSDGSCGKVTNVIMNPVTEKLDYIVVEDKKSPQTSNHLIPAGKVEDATQEQIKLRCTLNDVANMPAFITTYYIQETARGGASTESSYFFPYSFGPPTKDNFSYVVNNTGYDAVAEENIPKDELVLASGMEIEASDGKVGKLDELVLDPESGEITHLLMREGHLWGKREMVIPISAVSSARGKVIHLKLNKRRVEELPTVQLRHIKTKQKV